MNVFFSNNKLQSICNDKKAGIRKLGEKCAGKLRQRLAEFTAAEVLSEISNLPPSRCHELTNRTGVFSVDLEYPLRLLFIPVEDPVPLKNDGGIDRERIMGVEIVAIEDTHDKKNQRRG